MTIQNLMLSSLAGASILVGGALCAHTALAKTQNNAYVNTTETTAETVNVERVYFSEGQLYQKPGSPIRYSYSMPKTVAVGQTVTLDLRLSEPFQTGDLRVSCNVKGDVSLLANSGSDNFGMAGSDAHDMQITFTANSLGRHYIQVEAASTESEYGQGFRNFSIPVQVGPQQPLPPHPGLKRTPSGQMVISMRATEEIK